jgi:DNA-binding beta-propeller fold protein YncE
MFREAIVRLVVSRGRALTICLDLFTPFVFETCLSTMIQRLSISSSLLVLCIVTGALHGQDSAGAKLKVERTARVGLPGLQPNDQVLLPNGWSLAPEGTQLAMGDFPVNVQIDPSGEFAAVLHCGYGDHEVRVVSLKTKQVVSSAKIDQGFFGMAFLNEGKTLAVSGGEDERVYLFPHADGYLSKPRVLQVASPKEKFVVSGLAPVGDDELLVCGLLGHQVKTVTNQGEIRRTMSLEEGAHPYAVCVEMESKTAYVSLWGKAKVAKVDLLKGEVAATWAVKSHPTEMVILDQGRFLLVACSDDNAVVMLDTSDGKQLEVIRTSLYPQAPNGSTPASLGVSPDGNVLLVANADNNNLAAFDIRTRGQSTSLGFLPVGWYPTSVRFSKDGGSILVANGKGLSPRANVQGANPNNNPPQTIREYVGGLFQGTLSLIRTPSPVDMARMTRNAFSNSPLNASRSTRSQLREEGNPIPAKVGDPSPIKHCVYIIKENRTYDQVFGDITKGNGDPSLCIFPEKVTPNHHALANQYVLLDNFYVESEVSADGHEWTMAAYATDFVEKTWPLTYRGGRGKLTYPAEGRLKISEPSSGYLWDRCREKGIRYFSFGEFVDNGPTPSSPSTTKIESLKGHFDPGFRSYDLDYPDVKRAERFLSQWKEFEEAGTLPQFTVLRLPNDHTYGTRVGKPTPTAMVAENDVALGMIVESMSLMKSWKETALFVVEDDAQNGADHVDAHRTVALVISPFTRLGIVDSTMYSTSSMLRTMELILGLEPMTQFDAAANPMYRSFQKTADLTPYKALQANVDLSATNLASAWGSKTSETLDLSKEDAADDLLFGDIIWRSVKGSDHPMPAPVRAAYVFREVEDE